MSKQQPNRKNFTVALLAGAAALCLASGIEQAGAFRGGFGGFRGGGFGGFRGGGGYHPDSFASGGSRFGDRGGFDRSTDAGFGRGGFGNVHSAGNFSDHADSFQQTHPEYQHNASDF
ncbi:MAG TPA: hypothetical protein VH855_22405, partial [Acetobacteraceae bacterium]